MRTFTQVDVFTDELTRGNPVAVVHDAQGLDDDQLARFANWTNLSETTFLLPPQDPAADYRVRIFTTARELPFAGHPTLGTARAWLAAGHTPRTPGVVVQECGAGLIDIRQDGDRLAFAAPPLKRGGPVDAADLADAAAALGVEPNEVVDAHWCHNGPPWVALLLRDAARVLAVRPRPERFGRLGFLGAVGPYPPGGEAAFEVRAFVGDEGVFEDPVTGSLNAAVAQWLIGAGRAPARYVAAQGTALGRRGRVFVEQADGEIWVGGHTVVGITGRVALG